MISAIIPTYNRSASLRRLLYSLAQQSIGPECLEVVVVDDGSTDDTAAAAGEAYPFALRYERQQNQGATKARNLGAGRSSGEMLVFIDDDISLLPHTLAALRGTLEANQQSVVLGALTAPPEILTTPFALTAEQEAAASTLPQDVPFSKCMTGLLAVRRTDFLRLGMFQDPTGGWPNWDDVDFGYRASRAGFRILRAPEAAGLHWDYSLASLDTAAQRWYRACRSLPRLLDRYPEILEDVPMIHDKTPLNIRQDSPRLAVKKTLRRAISSAAALAVVKGMIRLIERIAPRARLLPPLYRIVQGAAMLRGYQDGLRELRQARGKGQAAW